MTQTYTAIGYWNDADDLVITGIIRGEHAVFGGYSCSEGGPWATSFEAADDHQAELVAELKAKHASDEEDEDEEDEEGYAPLFDMDAPDGPTAIIKSRHIDLTGG